MSPGGSVSRWLGLTPADVELRLEDAAVAVGLAAGAELDAVLLDEPPQPASPSTATAAKDGSPPRKKEALKSMAGTLGGTTSTAGTGMSTPGQNTAGASPWRFTVTTCNAERC